MIGSLGLIGLLATLSLMLGRVLIVAIALRGTRPADRPQIILALNTRASQRNRPRASGVATLAE